MSRQRGGRGGDRTSPGRLERLLRARSLAFVGGTPALTSLRQCEQLGFQGDLWYVHPTREAGEGRASFRSVDRLPGAPDAALVAVNRSATVSVVAALAAIGAGAAVCYASGFAETGDDGRSLEAELLAAAAGMPIVGPNCYGTVCALTGAALWPDVQGLRRVASGVAFVTQSGNIAVNLTMQQRGLDVAHVITLGNQIDVGIEACMEALVAEPAVTALALHIEALTDVPRFVEAAAAAHRRGMAVVALKTGASAKAASIAASHTSSMVGDDDAYTALFERAGVRRVHSIPELLDTTNVMTRLGPLAGRRTVSLSCSGGEASLVADRAPGLDLAFVDFDDDHRARVAATLDPFVAISNPLDYHTFVWGDRGRLEACFAAVLDGPFDAAMLIVDFPRPGVDPTSWWTTLEALCAAASSTATPTVVAATMAENLPAEVINRAHGCGLAAVTSVEQALRAIEAAAWWGRSTAGPVRPAGPSPLDPAVLDEAASKALLQAAGVPVPPRHLVRPSDAADAAVDLGFPVVIKTVGPVHKSETGGVRVGLCDPAEVAAAANELAAPTGQVLVEAMIADAVAEILVNIRRSEPVGFVVTVGTGGTLVELVGDTRSTLLPVTPAEIDELLDRLACRPILEGHRGRPGADIDALVGLIGRVADLVCSDPSIVEIELNPVMAGVDDAVVVDAVVTRGTIDNGPPTGGSHG